MFVPTKPTSRNVQTRLINDVAKEASLQTTNAHVADLLADLALDHAAFVIAAASLRTCIRLALPARRLR